MLFEADLRDRDPAVVLAEMSARRAGEGTPLNPYVAEIVDGVAGHRAEIDGLLATYAIGWTIDRMPIVDRNALRIGVYEVRFRPDIPDAVAISEAVALVAELSTDESPGFVSGLLGRIAHSAPATHGREGPSGPPVAQPIVVDAADVAALLDEDLRADG